MEKNCRRLSSTLQAGAQGVIVLSKKIVITIDVEPDYTRKLNDSYLGVEIVVPKLLDILEEYDILCDFFVTSDVLERYPLFIKRVRGCKHGLGSHGFKHEFLSVKQCDLLPLSNLLPERLKSALKIYVKRNFLEQFSELAKAKNVFRKILGFEPEHFRAPNFSADHNTVRVLEQLGFKTDSSVLPGRLSRQWSLFPLCDFRGAPTYPYHASYDDIRSVGTANLLELPLTENPILRGAPLGVGFLNLYGVNATVKAIQHVKFASYITFLIHPYELVDLKKHYPQLSRVLPNYCFDNFGSLKELIKALQKNNYSFCDFKEVICSLGIT